MISLLYKIMGDINPLKQAVTKDAPNAAAKGGAEMGKVMGQQFKGAILKYMGLSAILSTITQFAADAAKILQDSLKANLDPETFQILTKASQETGKSIEELQEMMKLFPKEYAAMADAIRAKGGIIPTEQLENLAQVNKAMDEMKGGLAQLVSLLWSAAKGAAMFLYYFGAHGAGLIAKGLSVFTGNQALKDWAEKRFAETDVYTGDLMDYWMGTGAKTKPKGEVSPSQKFVRGATAARDAAEWIDAVMGGGAPIVRTAGASAAAASATYASPAAGGVRSPYRSIVPSTTPRDMQRLIEEVTGVRRAIETAL